MTDNPSPPPWYRQFWPWVLIALPATVVVASMVTIAIAIHNPGSLVVDNYYKVGLAINTELVRDQQADQFGLEARGLLEDDTLVLSIAGNPPPLPRQITLELIHATRADQDRSVVLTKTGSRQYTAMLPPLPTSRWLLQLQTDDWRLVGRLKTPSEDTLHLAPLITGSR